MNSHSILRQFDWILFIAMVLLVIFGIVTQYSLSLSTENNLPLFLKQIIFFVIGLILFFTFTFLDFRLFKPLTYLIYFLTIALLLYVLIFGHTFRAVKGWISIGSFNFQASELAKLTLILVLASLWGRAKSLDIRRLTLSLVLLLPILYLIMRQPDFGSASVLIIIWLIIYLLVEKSKKRAIVLLSILILLAGIFWAFLLKDYQKNRILVYLMPNRDSLGVGYQIAQSKIAIGSGELFGRGFGLGSQSQLHFLPATNTDFIFATFAEEYGAVASIFLLILYGVIVWRVIEISKLVYDNFGIILVLGIAVYFFVQGAMDIGMNIGLFPIVGISLPLASYGGSSLVISMSLLGLAESVLLHQPKIYSNQDDLTKLIYCF